jgi:hypothetical protein
MDHSLSLLGILALLLLITPVSAEVFNVTLNPSVESPETHYIAWELWTVLFLTGGALIVLSYYTQTGDIVFAALSFLVFVFCAMTSPFIAEFTPLTATVLNETSGITELLLQPYIQPLRLVWLTYLSIGFVFFGLINLFLTILNKLRYRDMATREAI